MFLFVDEVGVGLRHLEDAGLSAGFTLRKTLVWRKGRVRGISCYQADLLAYFNTNSRVSAAAIRVRWDCALRCAALCSTSLKPAVRINGCLQMFW